MLVLVSGIGTLLIGLWLSATSLNVLNASALVATLVALVWYKFETRGLRVQQEFDGEIRYHPWLKGTDLKVDRATFSLVTDVQSDISLEEYPRLKNSAEIETYLHGFLNGVTWTNSYLGSEKRLKPFCPPGNLALNVDNLKRAVSDWPYLPISKTQNQISYMRGAS